MPTIAELGIKIDSTDAAKASSVLDKLTAAAGRAEKATEGVARGADKASKATRHQTSEVSGLLGKVDPTSKALGRLEGLQLSTFGLKSGPLSPSTFSEYPKKTDGPSAGNDETAQQRVLKQRQDTLRREGQRAVLNVGHGDRQNKLNGELDQQEELFAKQKSELKSKGSDPSGGGLSSDQYKKQLQDLVVANDKATDQIHRNYADLQAAQGDWTNGATAALENYVDTAGDVAGRTKTLFTGAFSSMEDAVFNFAMTGKLSFSDLAKSIISDMARVAARQASSSLLSSLFGLGLSYFTGGGSAPTVTTGSVGDTSFSFNPQLDVSGLAYKQANGGAWSGGVQMFANGAAFTNNIVSTPTAFGMAGGHAGLMGEAGPEAIMPLTRTSSGALGVRSVGGGGSSVQISAPVTVVTQDRSGEGMQIDQQVLQQNLQKQMQAAAEKAVAESWRAGGVSYRNVNGRA
ncbi:phage tail tape measure protein [Pseudomonas sp. LP_7_YM]|uniref:phage tail tape measure protein n=1 Tax=Pseudomonas sp. LP_7_YM TaxID=2485137 RepID=UPI00105D1B9D|nr:phage tail tape measure protein [Pseudomonas sp. LP_7_YM]TDV70193.1 lambda family phage tail tape measure protein [Pseudomonas sp. LP_7_YM]